MPPVKPVSEVIKALSNEELTEQLREYRVNVGPILPSTRRVYERKLFELQTGERLAPANNYTPVDDDDDDDEAEDYADEDSPDEEVILQHHQPRQRTTRTTRTEMRSPPQRSVKEQRATAESAGSIPAWVKLITIVMIAVIIYLVIKNLEPVPDSEIPEQIEVNV